MSLSDLISIKSLALASIGAIVSIKAMNITLNVNKDNINVNGDGNNVTIIKGLERIQGSFTLLWNVFYILLLLTYPVWGYFYNTFLVAIAIWALPISIVWFVVVVRAFGGERLWDFWYVIGVVVACWFVYCSTPYLADASHNASQIPGLINYVSENGFGQIFRSNQSNEFFGIVNQAAGALLGFILIFMPLGYLIFSFTVGRSFDDALRRTGRFVVMCGLGYLLIAGLWSHHDLASLKAIFSNVIPSFPSQ